MRHVIVERIATDIEDIMKRVRVADRQQTRKGRASFRSNCVALLKYKPHTSRALFDMAKGVVSGEIWGFGTLNARKDL